MCAQTLAQERALMRCVNAQMAVGMATTQNGRSTKPHFIARWIIKPRHSGNASYKQQMGGRGVFVRNAFDTAVTFPELQGYAMLCASILTVTALEICSVDSSLTLGRWPGTCSAHVHGSDVDFHNDPLPAREFLYTHDRSAPSRVLTGSICNAHAQQTMMRQD